MEKTINLTLTDEQKKEIAEALGIPVAQLALQVAYAEAVEEDAKGNDAIIANVGEKPADGNVWVIEGVAMKPLRADGSAVFQDFSNVAGGLQGGYTYNAAVAASDARSTKWAQTPNQRTAQVPAQQLPGQKASK